MRVADSLRGPVSVLLCGLHRRAVVCTTRAMGETGLQSNGPTGWPTRGRSPRQIHLLAAVAVAVCAPGVVHAQSIDMSGHLRSTWVGRQAGQLGPLAQANARVPGFVPTEPSATALQAEWRAAARLGQVALNATATLQGQRPEGGPGHGTGWVNEAVASGSFGSGPVTPTPSATPTPTVATTVTPTSTSTSTSTDEAPVSGTGSGLAGWQWSLGKKVVSWDVGYAFRPNDVVQQEVRRSLAPATLTGRPLAMLERFDADTAWSLVWVNPGRSRALADIGQSGHEPALAARVYRRAGEADWHGFARWGRRTGGSVGAAVSWVASDALELHASARHFAHFDALASADTASAAPPGTALRTANPWQPTLGGAGQQVLVGGTWTHESQLSLLAEAWYDGTALSKAQWQQWATRNQGLPAWGTLGVPANAVAGNLAWQGSAFSATATGSLHRQNLYARLSWTHEAWQPALDVLYHPADGGRMLTASLVWQGDLVKLEGGLRVNAGPAKAVVRQLPVQKQAYVMGTWAF